MLFFRYKTQIDWPIIIIPSAVILGILLIFILPFSCQIDAWDYSDLDRKSRECPDINPLIVKAMKDDGKVSEWEYINIKKAHDACRGRAIINRIKK